LFFELENQIKLETPAAPENKIFFSGLEGYKNRVSASLDTCRDDADLVWEEFKRQAIIEIAQAQDKLIKDVKNNCLKTVNQCYKVSGDDLSEFGEQTLTSTGVAQSRALASKCAIEVATCVNLWPADPGCVKATEQTITQYINGRSNSTARSSNNNICGLNGLLGFITAVSDLSTEEKCKNDILNRLTSLCTPDAASGKAYPYNCKSLKLNANNHYVGSSGLSTTVSLGWKKLGDGTGAYDVNDIYDRVHYFAKEACIMANTEWNDYNKTEYAWIHNLAQKAYEDVTGQITNLLSQECQKIDNAMWIGKNDSKWSDYKNTPQVLPYLNAHFMNGKDNDYYGVCIENTEQAACSAVIAVNAAYASYNSNSGMCEYKQGYFKHACETILEGIWTTGANECRIFK
jgi:hypothetical protein